MKAKNLLGKRVGKVTVIRRDGSKGTNAAWLCKCDCGTSLTISGGDISRGRKKSCGCAHNHRKKHGMSQTKIYRVWKSMHDRCRRERNPAYERYGGRGIKVCDRWKSFENFIEDMGERPEGGTLERIDNDGNYEPDNCKWATYLDQARNRRTNKRKTVGIFEHNGTYTARICVNYKNVYLGT